MASIREEVEVKSFAALVSTSDPDGWRWSWSPWNILFRERELGKPRSACRWIS